MAEEIKEDSNCIIKAFENNNITIIKEDINTFLFKATDIGKILGLTNIRVTIQNFDEDEKCVRNAYTVRGDKDMIFLTSRGVYRVLYNSKKEIAKKFRKWVGNILDDLVFNQGKELKIQLDKFHLELEEKNKLLENTQIKFIQDKQQIMLNSYHLKSIVYLIKIKIIKNDTETFLYKFGNTDNINRRLKEHQNEIDENLELIYCIESKNNELLEQRLKDYLKTTKYRITKIFKEKSAKEKVQTELIDINDINIIQNKLFELNKNILEDREKLVIERLKLENENLKLKLQNIVDSNENEVIIKLKNKVLQLENELNRYRNGEIKTKVFSEDTYKHFINCNLQFNMKSKIELKAILNQLAVYTNKNNIKFLQQNMFSDNLQSFHGYNNICKEELITFIKELFPNAIYKDQGVKRHFVNISFKDSTTHYNNQVYKDFINEFIQIGNLDKERNSSYKFKVRTQTIINKFNNWCNINKIDSLFKMNENDSLFSKELQSKMRDLTNCIIKSVKYNSVDYQSFIGITLK